MVGDEAQPPVGTEEGKGPDDFDPEAEGLSARPSSHRAMQLGRDGKKKKFNRAARKVYLEWLAATGNCAYAAARAGFTTKTVWNHRMADAQFAEDHNHAVDQGIARAKARLIEDKAKGPIEIGGDLDAVELEPPDPALVLKLVGDHERKAAGWPSRRGRPPRVATNEEVEKALAKRLAVFARRERSRGGGDGGAG
ncbi:MAG: hypothetical protein QOJ94_939 [Sphingomonadales bacterium]|nr:hypothetical protein [Sphingomonadales bacterium]